MSDDEMDPITKLYLDIAKLREQLAAAKELLRDNLEFIRFGYGETWTMVGVEEMIADKVKEMK